MKVKPINYVLFGVIILSLSITVTCAAETGTHTVTASYTGLETTDKEKNSDQKDEGETGEEAVPAATLLLPYFEVESKKAEGTGGDGGEGAGGAAQGGGIADNREPLPTTFGSKMNKDKNFDQKSEGAAGIVGLEKTFLDGDASVGMSNNVTRPGNQIDHKEGVRVAGGDVTGDGVADKIAENESPRPTDRKTGVKAAAGDLNGDAFDDLTVGADEGAGPQDEGFRDDLMDKDKEDEEDKTAEHESAL